MASSVFRLDHAGMAQLLKSPDIAAEIDALGAAVELRAQHTTGEGVLIPTEVGSYVTDRVAVGVTLQHPAGVAIEAKYGVLAKAAAAEGLEVRTRGKK